MKAPPVKSRAARRAARLFFIHPKRTFRRLLAENATPRGLAAAAAFGVAVGASPFVGVHTLAVVFGAGRLGLNRVLAVAASQVGFVPVIPGLCIEVGYFSRHGAWLTELSTRTLIAEAPVRFWEWLVGWLIAGPVLAAAAGLVTWAFSAALRSRAPKEPPPPRRGLLGDGG